MINKKNELNSSETNWFEKYKEKQIEEDNKSQEIFSNANYINWLIKFTLENPFFFDNDWIYSPDKISKEDYNQVNSFSLLYKGIEKYATENYLYPIKCDFGSFYRIKFENIGFEIGCLIGQGTLIFCNRVEVKNDEDFIDFNDIINNKKMNNITYIKTKLNELENFIVSLHKSGIPIEALDNTSADTIKKIKAEDELEQQKVLTKNQV